MSGDAGFDVEEFSESVARMIRSVIPSGGCSCCTSCGVVGPVHPGGEIAELPQLDEE
jgi:hypothetical protein